MGQIVIDIPNRKNRRFVIDDAGEADLLLAALELSTIRVKRTPAKLSRQELQDLRDGLAADKSIAEARRTGVTYSVKDLRKKYGL